MLKNQIRRVALVTTGVVTFALFGTSGADASPPAQLVGPCAMHNMSSAVDNTSPVVARLGRKLSGDEPAVRRAAYDGSVATQLVPPKQWKPATATNQELAYYGFPARPTDPVALRAWQSEWIDHYTETVPVDFCEGTGAAAYSSTLSHDWAGVIANGESDYTQAYGNVNVPSTGNPCGGKAVFDSWVGIGGAVANSNLVQNGFSVGDPIAPASAGGNAAWWEAINFTHPNPPNFLVGQSGNFIHPGDSLNMTTQYVKGHDVHFGWHDLTDGASVSIDVTRIAGESYTYYYDGRSAEWINEQESGLQPRSFADQTWSHTYVTRNGGAAIAPGSVPHYGVYTEPKSNKTMGLNPDSMLTSSSWRTHFFHCT